MRRNLRTTLLILSLTAVLGLGACATTGPRLATASALDQILASPSRPEAERARDVYRHPKQTLMFFGIRPGMTVAEISPGAGWYTRVLAPLVRGKGRLIAAVDPLVPGSAYSQRGRSNYSALLASAPELFDQVEVVDFVPGGAAFAPANSVDLIVTFRNIHNWMAQEQATAAFADMFKALKPGGVLGVVEHRGNPLLPQDPKARSGYVNQAYAVKLIEAAGFRLVGVSEDNANPKDTKDYPRGVWTLPPSYAEGDKDRARYAAIGESDRFTLKFIKPR
jgi:predicted methyltransferase